MLHVDVPPGYLDVHVSTNAAYVQRVTVFVDGDMVQHYQGSGEGTPIGGSMMSVEHGIDLKIESSADGGKTWKESKYAEPKMKAAPPGRFVEINRIVGSDDIGNDGDFNDCVVRLTWYVLVKLPKSEWEPISTSTIHLRTASEAAAAR
jgi:hypothetical protein